LTDRPSQRSPRRRRNAARWIAAIVVIAAVAGAAGYVATRHHHRHANADKPAVRVPTSTNPVLRIQGVNDRRFPASIYPVPNTPPGGAYPQCPSLFGVGPRPTLDPAAYAGIVSDFGHPSLLNDLRRADRSLWPLIVAADRNPPPLRPRQEMPSARHPGRGISVAPAMRDDDRGPAIHACGRAIVKRSVAVRIGPNAPFDPPMYDFWVLQRNRHLLIWGRTPTLYADGSFLAYRSQRPLMYPQPTDPCYSNDVPYRFRQAGNGVAVQVRAHRAGLRDFTCSLPAWQKVSLLTTRYAHGAPLVDTGPYAPLVLHSGQRASFRITPFRCAGPRREFNTLAIRYDSYSVDLSVGGCGAAVSGYRLDR
jgi:hypothetical protein